MVWLDEDDRDKAWACAQRMIAESLGMRDRFGKDSADSHYWGALGEIAFAKFRGVEWRCHPGDIGGVPDVDGYEVRSVRPDTRIYIKAKENDKGRIVVVVHLAGGVAALIVGWTTADAIRRHGKLEDWGGRNAPAYMLSDTSILNRVFP
jgi:hypothetical protein